MSARHVSARQRIEEAHHVKLTGLMWILDGAGPARYGYAIVHPCRLAYAGRTLADVESKLRGDAAEAHP